MAKSEIAKTMDELQAQLRPFLQELGFRGRGRTFNRSTSDGLVEVIGLQMGSFDPPGTTYFPGLRENMYGMFTVNLGVYVPEVARYHGGTEATATVHDYDCCIRSRLGRTVPGKEYWWKVSASQLLVDELESRFEREAFPLFLRFDSRDKILGELRNAADSTNLVSVPRIVCAIILWKRGAVEEARQLLSAQARESTRNPSHAGYVIELGRRLGMDITS